MRPAARVTCCGHVMVQQTALFLQCDGSQVPQPRPWNFGTLGPRAGSAGHTYKAQWLYTHHRGIIHLFPLTLVPLLCDGSKEPLPCMRNISTLGPVKGSAAPRYPRGMARSMGWMACPHWPCPLHVMAPLEPHPRTSGQCNLSGDGPFQKGWPRLPPGTPRSHCVSSV